MEEKFKIDVALCPVLYDQCKMDNSIVVVIDVLRATSAICTAFESGVKEMIPVSTLDEARVYHKQGYLVGAERDGSPIEEFDFGNSPYSYKNPELKGKSVVLTTTNGTKAINMAKEADVVAIGAFTNISVLSEWLVNQDKNIVFLCAGWKGRFNLEDSVFAGAVIERIGRNSKYDELTDSCLAVKSLFINAEKNPYNFLSSSSHRIRMHKLNLKKDVKYCLTYDQSTSIPILKGDKLVKLEEVYENMAS